MGEGEVARSLLAMDRRKALARVRAEARQLAKAQKLVGELIHSALLTRGQRRRGRTLLYVGMVLQLHEERLLWRHTAISSKKRLTKAPRKD